MVDKRKRILGVVFFVVVVMASLLAAEVTTPRTAPLSPLAAPMAKTPTPIPTPHGGLLNNPSFEAPYQCPQSAVCTAWGWKPWWVELPDCEPWRPNCWVPVPSNCIENGKPVHDWGCYFQRPEFSEMTIQYPYRVHAGYSAQKIFTYGRMGEFGVYQQVAATPGVLYEFSVYMEGWLCDNYDLCNGGKTSHYTDTATLSMRIGIDPMGGTVPTATTVVWTPYNDTFDHYGKYSVSAIAVSTTVTVFTWAAPRWPYSHTNNDVYIDDARLIVVPIARQAVLPVVSNGNATSPTPTPLPTPGPAPTTAVTYALPVNRGGLHVSAVGSHNGFGALLQGCHNADRPIGVIKVLCDGGSAMQAEVTDPRTTTIYRCFTSDGHGDTADNPPGNWEWDSSQTHQVAVDWMKANYKNWMVDNNPAYMNFYEVTNEANPVSELQWKNFTDFNIECMKIADTWGIKLAIGSFSSGTPENYQIEWFRPAMNYAAEHGHILAVHDGSVDGDRPAFQQAYQDGTALRYRQWNFPGYIAVTECYAPDYYRKPNWADFQWYLDQLAQDNVFGCAWFELGDYDFGGGSVNVNGQLEGYADAMGCDWPEQMYRRYSR